MVQLMRVAAEESPPPRGVADEVALFRNTQLMYMEPPTAPPPTPLPVVVLPVVVPPEVASSAPPEVDPPLPDASEPRDLPFDAPAQPTSASAASAHAQSDGPSFLWFTSVSSRGASNLELQSPDSEGPPIGALRAGFKVSEVPIRFRDREAGESKMSLPIAFEALMLVPKLRWPRLSRGLPTTTGDEAAGEPAGGDSADLTRPQDPVGDISA